MSEISIPKIVMEIESEGSFAVAQAIAEQALLLAGISRDEESGPIRMTPVAEKPGTIQISYTNMKQTIATEQ